MSVGDIVWPVLQTNLTGVVTVSEHEIISTNKLVSRMECKKLTKSVRITYHSLERILG